MKYRSFCIVVVALFISAVFIATPVYSSKPHLQTEDSLPVETEVIVTLPANYVKGSMVFSGDGEKYAYLVGESGGQQAIYGEQKGKVYKKIGRLRLSPLTNRLFYYAQQQTSAGKLQLVLVADNDVIPTDFINEGSLIFSKDGLRWAVMGGISPKGDVIVFLDGEKLGPYKDAAWPSFSPDGKHLAFLIKDGSSKISLSIDGKIEKTFDLPVDKDKVSFYAQLAQYGPNLPPYFSIDYLSDSSLLMLTQDQQGWTIYKDETVLASYPHNKVLIGDTIMSFGKEFKTTRTLFANSLNYASATPVAIWWERLEGEEEQWRVMIDGKPADDFVCTGFWGRQQPTLSADGQHYIYPCTQVAKDNAKNNVFVVSGGKQYGPYTNVWGMKVSDNGEHFGYAASDGTDKQPWSFYLDGKAFDLKYENVFAPKLTADGSHIVATGVNDKKNILTVDGQEITSVTPTTILWGPNFDDTGHVRWVVITENKVMSVTVALT